MRLLILGLLFALGLGSYFSFRYLADREASRQVQSTASDTQQVLNSYIRVTAENVRLQLKDLNDQAILKNATMPSGSDFTVEDRLTKYAVLMGLDGLAITTGATNTTRYSNLWPLSSMLTKDSPGVADGKRGDFWAGVIADHHVSLDPKDPANQVIALCIVAPFEFGNGGQGAFVGVKVFDRKMAESLCFSRSDRIVAFFVGDQPAIWAPFNADDKGFEASVRSTSRPVTVNNFDHTDGIQQGIAHGRLGLGAYRPIPTTKSEQQIGLVSYTDYATLIGPLREMSNFFLVLLLAMLIVGLFFGEQLTSSLTKPLEQVVQAARAMQNGEPPPSFNTRGRQDEIGTLQRVFNDMVEAVDKNRKLLLGLIEVDPLTDLKNHRSFQERVEIEFHHARESKRPLALIVLDLDHFKSYNQVYGLAAGDDVLKQVSVRLRRICEPPLVLARFGGDEFAVLVPGMNEDATEALAHQIVKGLADLPATISCSIGIGDTDFTSETADALVLSAELALRRSKQLGGSQISRFASTFDVQDSNNSQLLSDYFSEGSLATVQALAAAVDAKDPYTKGHSERVAEMARDLAIRMQCKQAFVEMLYAAGTLHDVGKIGVPDAIIAKPSALTREESSVMETHPVLGEMIVAKVPQLAPLLPGVRHHHERWDGAGYPDGLAGEAIPMQARYLAVADTFDAMTSDRPYRKALPDEVALAEIERCAGAQFQLELAREFVAMVRETRKTPVES